MTQIVSQIPSSPVSEQNSQIRCLAFRKESDDCRVAKNLIQHAKIVSSLTAIEFENRSLTQNEQLPKRVLDLRNEQVNCRYMIAGKESVQPLLDYRTPALFENW